MPHRTPSKSDEQLRDVLEQHGDGLWRLTGGYSRGRADREDLVLLKRNPRRDITSTRAIEWTMQDGERVEPAVLLGPIRR